MFGEFANPLEVQGIHRIDRKPRAFLADDHFAKHGIRLDRLEGEHLVELADKFKIYQPPARVLWL